MQMPDTDNIHYQYAFKKGYRMAIDGKKVTSMPSEIRRDMAMRDYFQQGWEQAVEDATAIQERQNKPNWRHRFIWFAFMIMAGLATAMLMISNIEREKAEQQAIIDGQPLTDNSATPKIDEKTQTNITISTANDGELGLLSAAQRSDLAQTKQTQVKQPIPLSPIVVSSIQVANSAVSQQIENRQPSGLFNDDSGSKGYGVPKYIREVYFYTEIDNADGQSIYHRWRTDTEILATIKLPIKSDSYRTWSSKKMSSAWQGQWYIEVLDHNKNVIFRQPFYYGTRQ